MVGIYLRSKGLKFPAGLAEDEGISEEEEEGEEEEAHTAQKKQTAPQPEIAAVNLVLVLNLLTAPTGSESPNIAIRQYKLQETATAKQLARYERSHVTNPDTGQVVHKASVLAHMQKQSVDAKPGAGRDRYITGVRQPTSLLRTRPERDLPMTAAIKYMSMQRGVP